MSKKVTKGDKMGRRCSQKSDDLHVSDSYITRSIEL